MDINLLKEIKLQDDLFDARFHPTKDGLVAAATIGGSILLIENGVIKSTLIKHHKGSPIRRVRFDSDGRMITTAKTIKIYDLESSETTSILKRNGSSKSSFNAVLPLSKGLICAGDDSGSVSVWDLRSSSSGPIFTAKDCDQYISDIDGRYEGRRMFVCASGEGTLTAYDLRANKMIEPQSELFEAGFQCVKMVDLNKKVVIGGEDGAVYVFNQNEWAHTSGKFAISDDAQNRGKCSIESIDFLPDSSVFLVACSDGKLRSLTLWPHQILSEKVVCKKKSLECLHICPIEGKSEILVGGENYLNILAYEENALDDDGSSSDADHPASSKISSGSDQDDTDSDEDVESSSRSKRISTKAEVKTKKVKTDKEDYLNIFS